MRPLTHTAHRTFVETEGWEKKGTARSSARPGDHVRYTLTLANGDVLYTRVSHGSGQLDDPRLIAHVLRDQLQVSEDDFWACVDHGRLPPRPERPQAEAVATELDAKLVRNLIRRVGLSPSEVENLTKDEAVERWHRYLSEGGT